MDTGIWMQESFWESAGEQNAKNSAQENREHSAAEYLTEDRNGDGGNKPVDQEASPWQYAYENILIGMGLCGITLNFLLLNYILPFIGCLMIFAGFRRLRRENKWFKTGDISAAVKLMITMISLMIGSFIGKESFLYTLNRPRD